MRFVRRSAVRRADGRWKSARWTDDRDVIPNGHSPPKVRPDPALVLLEVYGDALPQVYGYLLARCGDPTVAEDLTAESFLAAVTACRRPEAPEVSVRWLIGVARHKL